MSAKGKRHRRMHLAMAAVWATAGLALTIRNPDSVLWVALMSLYANFVGHLAGYEAARPDEG